MPAGAAPVLRSPRRRWRGAGGDGAQSGSGTHPPRAGGCGQGTEASGGRTKRDSAVAGGEEGWLARGFPV